MDASIPNRPLRLAVSLTVALAALAVAGLVGWACGAPAASAQAPADPAAAAAAQAARYHAGELLVRFRPGVGVQSAQDALSAHGLRQADEIPALGVRRVAVPAGQEEALAAALRRDPQVAYAERNGILTVQETPNDPLFGQQWGMVKIGAPAAWDQVTGTTPITIAVVDTGVWGSHPDLVGKMVNGWYHYRQDASGHYSATGPLHDGAITAGTDDDPFGHGTHVAGIAAASTNNATGVAGVNWGAPIMPFRSQADDGNGSDFDVAFGVVWVTDHGAKVINISLGGGTYEQTLADAIAYAWGHGAMVVAAGGNDTRFAPWFPAGYPYVLAVAATTISDLAGAFFAHGSWIDVAAPGASLVLSTLPPSGVMTSATGYGAFAGTSMATPHAAGLAALIWSANPSLTNAQVTYILTSTAEKVGTDPYDASGWNEFLGYGRVHTPSPRIRLSGPATAEAHGLVSYTLVLDHWNLAPAASVVITDALPAGAAFLIASDGGVLVDGLVSWTIPSVPALTTVTRTLVVTASHDLVNSTYGASSAAGTLATGTVPVVTRVGPILSISKSGPAAFEPGAPFSYTLTVTNSGVQAASGLVITDALPSGAGFLIASDGGTETGGVVTWNVAAGLAPEQTVSRTVFVTATQSVTNSLYGATCLEGVSALGVQPVTSVAAYYHLYFPILVASIP